MEIVDVQKKYFDLRKELIRLFRDFENETYCEVSNIEVDRSYEVGNNKIRTVNITITVPT